MGTEAAEAVYACDLECGASYTELWKLGLHHYASEKGLLPDCGRGHARKVYADAGHYGATDSA